MSYLKLGFVLVAASLSALVACGGSDDHGINSGQGAAASSGSGQGGSSSHRLAETRWIESTIVSVASTVMSSA